MKEGGKKGRREERGRKEESDRREGRRKEGDAG